MLGDIVGPAVTGLRMRAPARAALAAAAGEPVAAEEPPPGVAVGDGIVVLDRVHRYGGDIAASPPPMRAGDADDAVALLDATPDDAVLWLPYDAASAAPGDLAPLRELAVATGAAIRAAAARGDAATALDALRRFRLLCAHRRGPHGARTWMAQVETWLAGAVPDFASEGPWYVGRPLLVTENDYAAAALQRRHRRGRRRPSRARVAAAFDRGGDVLAFAPARLGAVETVYAMTIHKAQGSQFATSAILLPEPTSPILTRELLYTAVTRAQERARAGRHRGRGPRRGRSGRSPARRAFATGSGSDRVGRWRRGYPPTGWQRCALARPSASSPYGRAAWRRCKRAEPACPTACPPPGWRRSTTIRRSSSTGGGEAGSPTSTGTSTSTSTSRTRACSRATAIPCWRRRWPSAWPTGASSCCPAWTQPRSRRALGDRFGLPIWQFTLSATQANTEALRVARAVTGRDGVVMFDGKYHGHADELLGALEGDGVAPEGLGDPARRDPPRAPRPVQRPRRRSSASWRRGDVACVMAEAAITNVGVILPAEGFHAGLRRLTAEAGALLALDETHTLVAGPGGLTARWSLQPDLLVDGQVDRQRHPARAPTA